MSTKSLSEIYRVRITLAIYPYKVGEKMLNKNLMLDGQILKSRRLSLKMSQSELAQNITTQATISLMENTNRVPNIAILLEILNRLNLNLASISATKMNYEEEIQGLFIKLISNEDVYNLATYQAEKAKLKNNQMTDVYKYLMSGLDYFYAKKADYSKASRMLESVVTDSEFINMNTLNKYVIYQYLALSKGRQGFVQVATNYFNQMMANEPNIDVIDDKQFKCILKIRNKYIEFLILNSKFQLSEHYIKETIYLCKERFTTYLVPNFYRQLARVEKIKGKNDLFLKYMFCADKIDSLLTI
ncbi:helix-turn-helix transcriptional regulator [Leuconostoc falkenbergense]|nr:helix-turn-helix transcriptional regulator [Leuconostoc falkenbergense]MDI6668157.1 helix-turn-helix transcriptional regulator [Leuconostoc falkenbergense]